MNELEERLNAVLSDPGELSRLTKMAQQLLGGEEETPAPEKEPPAGLPAGLTAALGALKGKGEPPLLQAVGPYLDDPRRTRLARALRIASTARMAGTALQSMGGLDGL